jgi:hypothetical protein
MKVSKSAWEVKGGGITSGAVYRGLVRPMGCVPRTEDSDAKRKIDISEQGILPNKLHNVMSPDKKNCSVRQQTAQMQTDCLS